MKAVLGLLWLFASAAAADPLSLEPVQSWVDSFKRGAAIPVEGRFHPVQSESDPEPRYYAFEPERAREPAALRYRMAPAPQFELGRRKYPVEAMASAWGFAVGAQAWDWDGIRVYRLALRKRRYTCLEGSFAGLGQSGSMALEAAVLVLEDGRAPERLYFAGFGATCRMVGDVTGDGRLGFVHLQRYDGGESARASVNVVDGRGRVQTVRAYTLTGVHSDNAYSIRVEPAPASERPARVRRFAR
ncbi:MAG: hypothetical protein JWM26_4070 [Betaproteobacteria bacterium]|nr:hypothetical protein [Betaproteobacteria bacterium]